VTPGRQATQQCCRELRQIYQQQIEKAVEMAEMEMQQMQMQLQMQVQMQERQMEMEMQQMEMLQMAPREEEVCSTALHCTAHSTALPSTALDNIALHWITLQCTA
jgi:hypothetical protein